MIPGPDSHRESVLEKYTFVIEELKGIHYLLY